MAKRVTVVVSQSQSKNPKKRQIEEEIVASLLGQRGIEVTVVPHLYDLAPDGTGMLCLQGITGDVIVCSWLYPRAAFWVLDRNDVRGQFGETQLRLYGESEDEDDQDEEDTAAEEEKQRVTDSRHLPARKIYCMDLRAYDTAAPYLEEIRRIAKEASMQTVELMGWISGSPTAEQFSRYLDPAQDGAAHNGSGNGSGNGKPHDPVKANGAPSIEGNGAPADASTAAPGGPIKLETDDLSVQAEPRIVSEEPSRRWYPVIDFSRCTNCMECIDFCLFGVYGVDNAETILVEQPDNCRKGCPACSRVCPENAIIFPQHKTPTIAGSVEKAGGLKIDLSQLFGAPDPGAPGAKDAVDVAVRERDEQLQLAGREAVGADVGIAKRQADKSSAEPKDELDNLIDELDELDI